MQIHRRLLHDDAKGVGEALNETAYGKGIIARGRHYVSFGSASGIFNTLKAQERLIQLEKLMQSWTFFSDAKNIDFESWKNNYVNTVSSKPITSTKLIVCERFRPCECKITFDQCRKYLLCHVLRNVAK